MNILFLTHALPYPLLDGWKVIDYNLIRLLSQRHKIFLLAFQDKNGDDSAAVKHLSTYCAAIETVPLASSPSRKYWTKALSVLRNEPAQVTEYRNSAMAEKIRQFVSEQQIDIVHVGSFIMGQYVDAFADIPRVIVPPDAFSLLLQMAHQKSATYGQKLYYYLKYNSMLRYERKIYRKFNVCYIVSSEDKEYLNRLCPELEIHVIPNGVDTNYFKPEPSHEDDASSLIFTGNMRYRPNWDAVLYFCQSIFPAILEAVPQAKFYVVGKDPVEEVKRLASDRVIVTGYVEDIRPYLSRCQVYVSPLREGTGIKNKILEAMSMGKAIVATSLSCHGIGARNGHDILLKDDAQEFAAEVVRLLKNAAERKTLGENARSLALQGSWEKTMPLVENLYNNLSNRSKENRLEN